MQGCFGFEKILNIIFRSIPVCWHGCTHDSMDVKELIPEFFYNPEFLHNRNNLNLGHLPSGENISSIVLPPWASSPHEFVQMNRTALGLIFEFLN